MYGCESWTIKKAKSWRMMLLNCCVRRRLLRVCWTARRSNKSILKEISPENLLEGLMLKLKLQYFGHLMWRTDSLEKTFMLEMIEGRRRRGWQRIKWLDAITNSLYVSLSKLWKLVMDRVTSSDMTEQMNWTELDSRRNHEIELESMSRIHIIVYSKILLFFIFHFTGCHIQASLPFL